MKPTTKEIGYLCLGLAIGTVIGALLIIFKIPG